MEWMPGVRSCWHSTALGPAPLLTDVGQGAANMDRNAQFFGIGRLLVVLTTALLLGSCWWTLQAFVPEPYFLRTPDQLRVMSTPNGLGQIERSLLPFYATATVEVVALAILALFAWFSKTAKPALCYLCAVLGMAAITYARLAEAFKGL